MLHLRCLMVGDYYSPWEESGLFYHTISTESGVAPLTKKRHCMVRNDPHIHTSMFHERQLNVNVKVSTKGRNYVVAGDDQDRGSITKSKYADIK